MRGSPPPARSHVVEGPGWLRLPRRCVAPVVLASLPPEVAFGFLGRVVPTSEPNAFYLEAHPIAPSHALELLHGARAVAQVELARGGATDARAAELEEERIAAEELGRQVASHEQDLWRVGLRFDAEGSSPADAEQVRGRLEQRLATLGFRSRVPRYQVRLGLYPPDPAQRRPRPRGFYHTLSTDGVAAFYPFVDETVLEPGGTLVGLSLEDAAPVFVDRWAHASHSWGVFGTTGSGKSFFAALTLLRSLWLRPETRVIVLDPLGEFGGWAQALGGSVVTLGRSPGFRINPLDPLTTGGDRSEKAARVAAMLRALFSTLRDEEAATLDAAVSRLFEHGPEVPTFSDLAREIDPHRAEAGRLAALLEVFRAGSLRALDGPTTVGPLSNPVVIDFRGVAEDHLPFHLSYVLDWAYGQLKATPGPKLLLVDEAHLLARHGGTGEFLDRVVRHVRHFQGGVLLLSQHPNDFLRHGSGRSLLGNLAATFLLRLPRPDPELASFFGLTDAEAEWIPRARLPREAGYTEGLLRMGELHLPLAIVASTPEFEFLTRHLGGGGRAERSQGASPTAAL